MTQRITNQTQVNLQQELIRRQSVQTDGQFGALLQQELTRTQEQGVAFSKHAMVRAEERGIEITPSLIDQLKGSMIRAQAKGATNILAMDAEKAFIINVPNGKVITAITQDEMKESVFTNIDGAVFL